MTILKSKMTEPAICMHCCDDFIVDESESYNKAGFCSAWCQSAFKAAEEQETYETYGCIESKPKVVH